MKSKYKPEMLEEVKILALSSRPPKPKMRNHQDQFQTPKLKKGTTFARPIRHQKLQKVLIFTAFLQFWTVTKNRMLG